MLFSVVFCKLLDRFGGDVGNIAASLINLKSILHINPYRKINFYQIKLRVRGG